MDLIPFCPLKSGRQDSNLRPPAPKAGAITGLRYAPKPKYSGEAVREVFDPPVGGTV